MIRSIFAWEMVRTSLCNHPLRCSCKHCNFVPNTNMGNMGSLKEYFIASFFIVKKRKLQMHFLWNPYIFLLNRFESSLMPATPCSICERYIHIVFCHDESLKIVYFSEGEIEPMQNGKDFAVMKRVMRDGEFWTARAPLPEPTFNYINVAFRRGENEQSLGFASYHCYLHPSIPSPSLSPSPCVFPIAMTIISLRILIPKHD